MYEVYAKIDLIKSYVEVVADPSKDLDSFYRYYPASGT